MKVKELLEKLKINSNYTLCFNNNEIASEYSYTEYFSRRAYDDVEIENFSVHHDHCQGADEYYVNINLVDYYKPSKIDGLITKGKYFVSIAYTTNNNHIGFGNSIVNVDKAKSLKDFIDSTTNDIVHSDSNIDSVAIINFIKE